MQKHSEGLFLGVGLVGTLRRELLKQRTRQPTAQRESRSCRSMLHPDRVTKQLQSALPTEETVGLDRGTPYPLAP